MLAVVVAFLYAVALVFAGFMVGVAVAVKHPPTIASPGQQGDIANGAVIMAFIALAVAGVIALWR